MPARALSRIVKNKQRAAANGGFWHKFAIREHQKRPQMKSIIDPASTLTPELLAKLIPLGDLKSESKKDLARSAEILQAGAGEYLFRIDDRPDKTFYLLSGQVELQDGQGSTTGTVTADTEQSLHRLPQHFPRRLSARCVTESRVLAVDSHMLDVMLTWDQADALQVFEIDGQSESAAFHSDDWMTRLLMSPAFQLIPPANLQAIFMKMQEVRVSAGEVVIQQGAHGDYFYTIAEGRCIVTREQTSDKPIRLAELENGSSFGEEALISDDPRNATVTMLTNGRLMRLSKQDFRELLKEPLTRRVAAGEAARMVAEADASYLDVRLPSEFSEGSLPGSINVPLYMLRLRLNLLSTDQAYICVSDTERRSAVAAFVLMRCGYDAYVLEGGLGAASSTDQPGN